jgi:hypothetical protein
MLTHKLNCNLFLDYELTLPEYNINTQYVGMNICAVGKYAL